MNEYVVYILRCADGSYYTGVTSELASRVAEHQSGKHKKSYTFKRLPVKLVYVAYFSEVTDAIAFEKQVKGWSRAKKKALIERNQEQLERFSESGYARRIRTMRVMVRRAHHDTLHRKKV